MVEAVAVVVEVVDVLRSPEVLDSQDRRPDAVGPEVGRPPHRLRQHEHRVVRRGGVEVGGAPVLGPVGRGELPRLRARVGVEVGDAVGPVEGVAGELPPVDRGDRRRAEPGRLDPKLLDLLGHDADVGGERHVGDEAVGARLPHRGQHRREVLLAVVVALDQDRRASQLRQLLHDQIAAAAPEGVGRVDDGDLLELQVVDGELRDDPGAEPVVGPGAEDPPAPAVGEAVVRAPDHDGQPRLVDGREQRLNLGRPDRPEDARNLPVLQEPLERRHGARVGRLVVLEDELDRAPLDAARAVRLLDGQLGAPPHVLAGLGPFAGDRDDLADLDRRSLWLRSRRQGPRRDGRDSGQQAGQPLHGSFHVPLRSWDGASPGPRARGAHEPPL